MRGCLEFALGHDEKRLVDEWSNVGINGAPHAFTPYSFSNFAANVGVGFCSKWLTSGVARLKFEVHSVAVHRLSVRAIKELLVFCSCDQVAALTVVFEATFLLFETVWFPITDWSFP